MTRSEKLRRKTLKKHLGPGFVRIRKIHPKYKLILRQSYMDMLKGDFGTITIATDCFWADANT